MTPFETLHVVSVAVFGYVVEMEGLIHVLDVGNELSRAKDASLGYYAV